jgi:hypothetical protein
MADGLERTSTLSTPTACPKADDHLYLRFDRQDDCVRKLRR